MREAAYAKINLALHVRSREPDGYHRIETVFAFAEDGDVLGVSDSAELSLTIAGRFAAGLGDLEDNLVLRAAEALRGRYGVSRGAALMLDKRLPVASGIGGGSADAAAALRLLTRWWGLDTDVDALIDIARDIGADVPACVRSETVRGEGRGDVLASQDGAGLAETPLLLVHPGVPVSTAAVFAGWDGVDRGPLPIASPFATALESRNDLEQSARRIAPVIDDVVASLEGLDGTMLTRMSGSGATCFALFGKKEDRDAASDAIAASHPQWWRLATRLR